MSLRWLRLSSTSDPIDCGLLHFYTSLTSRTFDLAELIQSLHQADGRMRLLHLILATCPLVSFTTAGIVPYAAPDPSLQERKDGGCPAIWTQVKSDLNDLFMTGNQCNDLARAAIRAVFHDCGSWDTSQGLTGGCDGSLILGTTPDVELSRAENRGLQAIAGILKGLAGKYSTSVSDMIVFAGSRFCPGSPYHLSFPLLTSWPPRVLLVTAFSHS